MIYLHYHAIEEILKKKAKGSLFVAKSGNRIKKIEHLAHRVGVKIKKVSLRDIDQLAQTKDHRGIVFKLEQELPESTQYHTLEDFIEKATKENMLVVVLDQVTDPHNYGAILRSADIFEADLVIIPNRRSASENRTVAATSAGANIYVPVITVSNLVNAIIKLKKNDFWAYSAEMNGKKVSEVNLKGKTIIVMGSEGKGVHRLLSESCDDKIAIPNHGHIDSLNVSVAAGIMMYEVRRQQDLSL
jgi:23S rRNA (guanosine2251-2'-O)-methyltransferase